MQGAQGPDQEGDSDIDDTATASKAGAKSGGIYRPPKVVPQHYGNIIIGLPNFTVLSDNQKSFETDMEELPKGKAAKEGRKRPEVNRNLIRELQEEYLETPVEVHNMGDAYVKRLSRETRDKQRYVLSIYR